MMISSQRYLNDAIVAEKQAARDYVVSVIAVTIDGVDYQVVTDGHHSLAAARAAGVEPIVRTQTATENDRAPCWSPGTKASAPGAAATSFSPVNRMPSARCKGREKKPFPRPKVTYENPEEAELARDRLLEKGQQVQAFRCLACGKYHVGGMR